MQPFPSTIIYMSINPPPRLNPDNTFSSIFNINDYKQNKGYVTFEDLLNYANLYSNNIFKGFNLFNSIQILGTINNISSEFLQYIQYIPHIIMTLTDVSYDEQTDTTIIGNNMEATNIKSSQLSSNTININNVNTNRVFSNTVRTTTLECKTMTCSTFISKDDIGLYLYINNLTFPLMKSNLLVDIYTDVIMSCRFTIKPNYVVEFVNSRGIVLQQYINSTDNIKYYINVSNLGFTKVKLYLNGEIL